MFPVFQYSDSSVLLNVGPGTVLSTSYALLYFIYSKKCILHILRSLRYRFISQPLLDKQVSGFSYDRMCICELGCYSQWHVWIIKISQSTNHQRTIAKPVVYFVFLVHKILVHCIVFSLIAKLPLH